MAIYQFHLISSKWNWRCRSTIYSAQCMLGPHSWEWWLCCPMQGCRLQVKKKCSIAVQNHSYVSPISLTDNNDSAAPPKSGYFLCMCVQVDFCLQYQQWWTTLINKMESWMLPWVNLFVTPVYMLWRVCWHLYTKEWGKIDMFYMLKHNDT